MTFLVLVFLPQIIKKKIKKNKDKTLCEVNKLYFFPRKHQHLAPKRLLIAEKTGYFQTAS